VLVGGLSFGTVLTLILLPTIYALVKGDQFYKFFNLKTLSKLNLKQISFMLRKHFLKVFS